MTIKEEYYTTILSFYTSGRDFIKWSKVHGLRKKELQILVNSCIKSFDVITTIASQDLFIDKDECLELVLYANKLSGYLRSFIDESNL